MNIVLNYLIFAVACAMAGFYIFCLVLNLIRSSKVKKELMENPAELVGKVSKVMQHKKKTYVKVQFVSPVSKMLFETFFEYFTDDFNNRFQVGDEAKLIYPEVAKLDRVYAFPLFLEGDKIKMPAGPVVTDLLLVGFSIYVVVSMAISMASNNAFTENVSVAVANSPIMLILYFVMHLLLITYAIDRLIGAPQEQNQNYLEIYGVPATAQVKTFKLAGAKNSKGFKESQLEIEYCNHLGENVKARCRSYFYTETQEEYISILYDPKSFKNVVYIKSAPKEKKKNKNK